MCEVRVKQDVTVPTGPFMPEVQLERISPPTSLCMPLSMKLLNHSSCWGGQLRGTTAQVSRGLS